LIWNLCFGAGGFDTSGNHINPPKSDASHREIWLSNLDGSQMRRLEDQAFYDRSENDPLGESGLIGLQWSPDGKYISYLYDRVLYLVTVP